MIHVTYEEHCPHCGEELDISFEAGIGPDDEECLECGTKVEIQFSGKLELSFTKRDAA